MARTKASVGAKVAAGKSNKARCSAAPPPSTPSTSGTSKSSRNYSGGNPVCPRETPKWQKPITNFYVSTPSNTTNAASANNEEDLESIEAGPSKSKAKRNIIESDDEETAHTPELPKNNALDESLLLEPLNGESSHKIEEYYKSKDKGKGKKSNKENIDVNGNRKSGKRDLENDEESGHSSKRVKIS